MSWWQYPSPWSWVLLLFDTVILSYTAIFSLVVLSHIVAMWLLRKDFDIQARCVALKR